MWSRRAWIQSTAAVGLGLSTGLLRGEEPAKKEEKPKYDKPVELSDIDILKEVKEWNSAKFATPPTQFRQGHVTPRELAADATTKQDKGYTIKLPSGAPIPTPSVYAGKLFVSGGFHSKEFYCFEAATGKFVWGMNLDDDGPTSAACDDGVIVFNTESCTVFALAAETGKQLWSWWLGDPLTSTPTISRGIVFTSYPAGGGGQQQLNAVPQEQEAPKQPEKAPEKEKETPPQNTAPQNATQQNAAPPQAAPFVREGEARGDKPHPPCSHVLCALDLKTGKILWQRWIESDVMSAPVAIDDELYITTFAGVVYKFRQKDGEILSARKSRATSAPVIVGQNIYLTRRADNGKGPAAECVAGLDRWGQAKFNGAAKEAQYLDATVQRLSKQKAAGMQLDAANGFAGGAPAQANPHAAALNVGQDNVSTMQAFQGSRMLHYAGKNFNCMGDEIVSTDPTSGKQLWSKKIAGDLKEEGGALAAPPVLAGGHLFIATLGGEIWQMEPEKGEIKNKFKIGQATRFQPAIEGGRIYVGTQNGQVICINTGDAKLTGWPCWGANPAHTGVASK